MYLKKQTNKGGEKRIGTVVGWDKVKPMQSRFFFYLQLKMARWCTLSYLESITSRVSDGSCRSYGSLKRAILDLVSNNMCY